MVKYNLYIKTRVTKICGECGSLVTGEPEWKAVRPTEGAPYEFETPREAWCATFGSLSIDVNKGVCEQKGIDAFGHEIHYKVLANQD